MGFTIDIDTGGTFTDGIVVRGQDVRTVKVPTTPHDLTVCFSECISACAEAFDISVEAMLGDTEIVRFCNTIGTNTIIQRDGSKLGLIVTAGAESLAPTQRGDAPAPLVAADLVCGLDEKMSATGVPERSPTAVAVLTAAQSLIDRGARALVVALANSERNPVHERQVREIIKSEYPRDYLGSVPVFLASDVSTRSGYAERVNTAVINAYIHGKLARLLYKAGEDLRQREYRGVLFIGHNNGAAARVAKTRAINTYNSGPTAGLLGARAVGRLYGFPNVISTDMGGTSFDIGVVRDGRADLALEADVEGFPCNLPMMSIRALGAGGGSIASVVNGALKVGPNSAGAMPGPACFDRGGTLPTVTDANVVLGLLDPEYFLGGHQHLDVSRARAAIEQHIARPLGMEIEQAALAIKAEVDRMMGEGVAEAAADLDKRQLAIVAYGGAGPLHACSIARIAGIQRTVLTPFSAVFSAFSSSLMDVGHLYYRRLDVPLDGSFDPAPLAAAEQAMRREAERDMRGEGLAAKSLAYELHLLIGGSGDREGREVLLHAQPGAYADRQAWASLIDQSRAELARMGVRGEPTLNSIGLFVSAPTPHIDLSARRASAGEGARPSGTRRVFSADGWHDVPVFPRASLSAGTVIAGPALIDSVQTTIWLEAGWRIEVDQYDNATIAKAAS
ncbi:MAG TPA: hydantoinase/oxoprolinase family protein [Steroidobacter sp.]|uniref:hydantoinase/oxoprolinase family protein n=1 Tax=Steroidobacter sp. TaxID=1978227 RepID=UPI002ED79F7D